MFWCLLIVETLLKFLIHLRYLCSVFIVSLVSGVLRPEVVSGGGGGGGGGEGDGCKTTCLPTVEVTSCDPG